MFKHLEASIKELGAYVAWQHLMYDLGRIYKIDENRFQINEESGSVYPVLYHLILKVMTNQSTREDISGKNVKWADIKNIANHLIILSDLRDNCYIQFQFPEVHDNYIEQMIYYSGIFDVHQYNPLGVLFLVERIIDDNKVKLSSIFGISTAQIKKNMYEFVQSVDRHIKEIQFLSLNHLNTSEEQKLFLNHMSTMGPVNKNYNSPYDWDSVDDDSVWLLKKDNMFCFLPNTIAAWGIYDKICSMLAWPDDIGKVVEKAVADLFNNYLHLNVESGTFILDKCKYESDGIIINDDYAIIIECKQKSLTRQARSGDSKKVLDDIACAYLYSQAQAFRVERAIRTADKYLYLYQDKCKNAKKGRSRNSKTEKRIIIDVSNVKRIIRLTCVCGNFWILSETGIIKHIEEQYINKGYILPHKKEVEAFLDERKKLLDIISDNREKRVISMNRLFLAYDKLHQIVVASRKKINIYDAFFKLSRIQSKQNDTMNHLSFIMNM